MAVQVTQAQVVFRRWDTSSGLTETVISIRSLEELFARCLELGEGRLVDRVIIDGVDEEGSRRRLTLAFHAVTVSSPPASP